MKFAPASALPIGATAQVDETHLLKIDTFTVLLNTILAVSNSDLALTANDKEEQELLDTNIAGFVYV